MAEEHLAPPQGDLHRPDLSALDAWDCDLVIPKAEHERLGRHPRLNDALYILNQTTLDAPAADRTLLGVFKDAGCYVSAMWAIFLHESGGLTLQSLKDLCARSGLLSPGRARALLLYMRYLGYVEPARERASPALYVPTARFRNAWILHMRIVLEATCVIAPAARRVIECMDDPLVFRCIVRTQGEGLFNSAREHDVDNALFRVFLNRHAGTLMLACMLGSRREADYPPHRVVVPSAADAARRYQVSRIQVRRLLIAAEKEGLMQRLSDTEWQLQPDFRDMLRLNHTMQLRQLLLSTARAARLICAT